MKIEIEFEEVEKIRRYNKQMEEKLEELGEKLRSLEEPKIKERIVNGSKVLFRAYFEKVASELGMDPAAWESVRFDGLEHWVGAEWWKSDLIQVTLSANITSEWRSIFLSLGVKTPK